MNVFAKMEHPRGLIAQDGKVWVLHPPFLSVFHDEDGDGVSDRQDVLVSGLTTSLIDERGGDHTTNGIRMGIDGWIYIAVGDYGFHGAKGKDGTTLSQRGGGILRVRPDGTELEVFAIGLRNPFAIAIDPYMNLFTRDNTNDGAGWDVRVSHLIQTADYGYSQRFANFPDEIMPPLGAYGQGGGTGALFLQDERWPEAYRGVAPHRRLGPERGLPARPAARRGHVPRRPEGLPDDPAADGHGHRRRRPALRGELARRRGQRLRRAAGRFHRVRRPARPGRRTARPRPEGGRARPSSSTGCAAPNAAASIRLPARDHPSRSSRRRRPGPWPTLASDRSKPLHGRVAALFALKQLDGTGFARDACGSSPKTPPSASSHCGPWPTARRSSTASSPSPFVAALADPSPRVRAQALIALGRLGDVAAAATHRPPDRRARRFADADDEAGATPSPTRTGSCPTWRMRALVALRAVDACLDAIDGPHREGALRALRSPARAEGRRRAHQEAGHGPLPRGCAATSWRRWSASITARRTIKEAGGASGPTRRARTSIPGSGNAARGSPRSSRRPSSTATPRPSTFLRDELARHRVRLEGLPADSAARPPKAEEEIRVVIAKADPKNPDQIGNMTYESAARRALQAKGDAERGKALFASQSCRACHTDADGQTPKGPHLVDIGKRYSPAELVESILKPSAKIAQGYEAYGFAMADGRVFTGFVVSEGAATVQIRESSGALHELKRADIEERRRQEPSAMPEGIAGEPDARATRRPGRLPPVADPNREIRPDRDCTPRRRTTQRSQPT